MLTLYVILKGHIIAAALYYFNMKSVDDDLPPQVIGDLKQLTVSQRKVYFNQIVQKVIGTKTSADDKPDGVFKYAQD